MAEYSMIIQSSFFFFKVLENLLSSSKKRIFRVFSL